MPDTIGQDLDEARAKLQAALTSRRPQGTIP